MSAAEEIVVSPGVDLRTPGLAEWVGRRRDSGEPLVVGEIALFVRAARAPIAAITGSNAKSTVTTLLGEMAQAAGRRVAVMGVMGELGDGGEAEQGVLPLPQEEQQEEARADDCVEEREDVMEHTRRMGPPGMPRLGPKPRSAAGFRGCGVVGVRLGVELRWGSGGCIVF